MLRASNNVRRTWKRFPVSALLCGVFWDLLKYRGWACILGLIQGEFWDLASSDIQAVVSACEKSVVLCIFAVISEDQLRRNFSPFLQYSCDIFWSIVQELRIELTVLLELSAKVFDVLQTKLGALNLQWSLSRWTFSSCLWWIQRKYDAVVCLYLKSKEYWPYHRWAWWSPRESIAQLSIWRK